MNNGYGIGVGRHRTMKPIPRSSNIKGWEKEQQEKIKVAEKENKAMNEFSKVTVMPVRETSFYKVQENK